MLIKDPDDAKDKNMRHINGKSLPAYFTFKIKLKNTKTPPDIKNV